jgi:hypothetical protein
MHRINGASFFCRDVALAKKKIAVENTVFNRLKVFILHFLKLFFEIQLLDIVSSEEIE